MMKMWLKSNIIKVSYTCITKNFFCIINIINIIFITNIIISLEEYNRIQQDIQRQSDRN